MPTHRGDGAVSLSAPGSKIIFPSPFTLLFGTLRHLPTPYAADAPVQLTTSK